MDGKIQYELTLEAQKALSSLRLLESNATKTGSRIGDIMQRALDRSSAAALSAETQKTAGHLGNAVNASENLAKQLNKGHSQMKSMALLAGGLALEVGGSALRASGYSKEASILQGAGQSGLQMALTGSLVGGSKGGIIGAVAGIAAGGLKGYFDSETQRLEEMRSKAEAWTRALQESNLAAGAMMRQIGRIDTSAELYEALSQIEEKIADIQKRSKYGLIDSGIAQAQTEMLENAARTAYARLPAVVRSEQAAELAGSQKEREKKEKEAREDAAAGREAALRSADQARFGVEDAKEKFALSESLANAPSSGSKLAILDSRNRLLEERIKAFDAFLKSAESSDASPEAISQASGGFSDAWSELLSNRGMQAQMRRSAAVSNVGTLDSLGASGGYMRGSAALRDSGALSSAAADLSRQTARNTGEMVVLLRQLAGRKGAAWQRR